jgi:hypothetical protein
VRIDKGKVRKLSELEDHLYLLRQQYNDLTHDPAHLYVIAAELRALVCFSSGTEGLLWRLAEVHGVSDVVSVRAVGGINPDHSLARGLRLFVPTLMRPDAHAPPRLQCQGIEMKALVKTCLGAYTLGKSFTHEQLIKKIAEQIGSAHIDDGLEPGLATMEELLVSGRPTYSSTLAMLASLTLEVGERIIATAVERGIFKRRRYSPPFTLSVHGSLLEIPLGKVPIVSFELYASAIRLDAYMTPQSFLYVVSKRGRTSLNLAVLYPKQWRVGEEAIFCLSYDHAATFLQVIGPNQKGDRQEDCDLGFIWTSRLEWSEPQFHDVSADYVRYKAFYVHSRVHRKA